MGWAYRLDLLVVAHFGREEVRSNLGAWIQYPDTSKIKLTNERWLIMDDDHKGGHFLSFTSDRLPDYENNAGAQIVVLISNMHLTYKKYNNSARVRNS